MNMTAKYISTLALALALPSFAVGCTEVDDDFRGIPVPEEPGDEEPGDEEPGDEEPGDEEPGDEEPGDDEPVCVPNETELVAGQHTETGFVTVANEDGELLISVDTANGYLLAEVHVYAGTDPVPTVNGGSPAPGQFPYTIEINKPVASYDLAVALDELGVDCGELLNVAVHAVVVSYDGEIFAETAWGYGDETFDGSWGWSFDYDICCEPGPVTGGKAL